MALKSWLLLSALLVAAPSAALAQEEGSDTAWPNPAQEERFGGTEIVVTGRELDMSERAVTRQVRTISAESTR